MKCLFLKSLPKQDFFSLAFLKVENEGLWKELQNCGSTTEKPELNINSEQLCVFRVAAGLLMAKSIDFSMSTLKLWISVI